MDMRFTIAPATDEEVRSGFVGQQLREYNYRFVGEYPPAQHIRLNARAADGAVVGGLRALVVLGWLRVEVLWVADAARGQGLGSALLHEAEQQARALGAQQAALETFEWQAPRFYEKQGYTRAATLDDYAGGYYLAIMRKQL